MNRTFKHSWYTPLPCATLVLILLWNGAIAGGPSQSAGSSNAGQETGSTQTAETAEVRTVPDLGGVDWVGWETVEELLNDVRKATGIPAIAAAVVRDGNIVDSATVGVRKFGTQQIVGSDDRFHLGSITKSMTATVVGKLVEQGDLTWSTTVESVLPDMPMRREYRSVTVLQLLHHRGGLPAYQTATPEERARIRRLSGTPTEKRAAFLADVLQEEPVGRPGETMQYSNAGYALAGHIAERVTGKSWEDLMRQHIFSPLSMTSAGFGFPGTSAVPDQPSGHGRAPNTFVPISDGDHPRMEIIAPAGNVHCSVRDLGRYAIFHLKGLNGEDGYLRSETVKRLHTLPPRVGEMQYACGWMIQTKPSGETVHHHGGTTGLFYAELELYPQRRAGVAILMNVGRTIGELVANKVGRSLMARYAPNAGTIAASSPTRQGQFQFTTTNPESGWAAFSGQWKSGNADSVKITMGEKASPEDDARTWSVVKSLAEAINNEDRKAFLSLFREERIRSQKSVFNFMAKQVLPGRGGIQSFHKLSPPIKIPESKFPIRSVTFHLENGFPGYFGISLDEQGKIDHFSLFVKSDLCPNGPDTQCDKIAKTLAKDFAP